MLESVKKRSRAVLAGRARSPRTRRPMATGLSRVLRLPERTRASKMQMSQRRAVSNALNMDDIKVGKQVAAPLFPAWERGLLSKRPLRPSEGLARMRQRAFGWAAVGV